MTKIEWTDKTWNPVTGCSKVSPGCDNCYMFATYPRNKAMRVPGYQKGPDRITLLPERLYQPFAWKKPKRVFVCSMSDLFHRDVPDDFINTIMFVMRQTSWHTYQVLTKRPGRVAHWWKKLLSVYYSIHNWPPNVWLGTSIESQKYAPRLDVLGRAPASVRFVSAEPLLGPLDLRPWLKDKTIRWVIAGGESGPRARPMDLDWARDLRDQCKAAGAAFFLKQLGGRRNKRSGAQAVLDGRLHQNSPFQIIRHYTISHGHRRT